MSNISSNMYQGLVSLLDINSQMQDVQARLSTGKKLNSAADGAVQWLTVTNFQTRVGALQNINDGMTTALAQLKSASTALTSIRKNINDTLSSLKDALTTQAAVTGTQPDVLSDIRDTKIKTQFTVTGGQISRSTSFDLGVTALKPDSTVKLNGQNVAVGSVFKFSFGPAGSAVDRFIKIGLSTDVPDNATNNGTSSAKALVVTNVGQFLDAFANLSGVVTNSGDIGAGIANGINFTISYNSSKEGNNAISIAQVMQGTNASAKQGDVSALFSASNTYTGKAGNYEDATNVTSAVGSTTVTYRGIGHTGTSNGQVTTQADAKRKVAANAVTSLVDQINQLVRDARTNGVNLLAGDDLQVVINAENDTMPFQFGTTTAPQSFYAVGSGTTSGLGLDLKSFKLSGDVITNFDNDDDLKKAIDALSKARDTSDVGIANLGTWQSNLQNRADFNGGLMKILNAAVTAISSNDATADAAELASLQSRQTFANSILSIIKQGEQNPIQLLR